MSSPAGSSLRLARHHTAAEPVDGRVALTLLRGFALEWGGERIELPLGSQRLVAFLALHRRPLSRSFVAGNLWIDQPEEHANANLRTAVWRIQRLDCPLVDASRSQLALAPDVVIDLHETNDRARQLIRRDGTAPLEHPDELLFEGDLLADWYDDWVLIERERFRQLRLHALETLCANLAAAGAYGLAVEVGLACIAAEPLRESAHRTLIAVYRAEGNPGEMLRQYDLYRKLVTEQLGVEPSAEMQHLVRDVAGS